LERVVFWVQSIRRQYQFVRWLPEWQGFHFLRLDYAVTDMALIYEWYLDLGWWEIRKWTLSDRILEMLKEVR
jgi:hypothetical protein